MSWTSFWIELLVLPVFVLCAATPLPSKASDFLALPVVSPALPFLENSSATTGNTSFGNILKVRCDAVRYGRSLNVGSCRNVFDYMNTEDVQTLWADRTSVQPHDVDLPFRLPSNDGRCYVQPILAEGAVLARATPREVANAAYTLFEECVVRRGMGGIAGDIGGDNKLNVIVASYKPNMRCNSFPGPPWSSCVSLFSEMPADKNRQTFGHLPHQRVQVQLPLTYTAADRRCMVKMDINGEPTGLSWYEVWEAVVAVASACVHERQKCGKATGLGLGRNIFLQLSDEHPDAMINPVSNGSRNLSLPTIE